jgi:hypothetical protein
MMACWLASCGTRNDDHPSKDAKSTPSAPQVDCGEPVRGADALFTEPGAVLIDETHGTREIPQFVGDLACQAARSGLTVHIGLEISRALQPDIDNYLRTGDRDALLASEFWSVEPPFADGRSSWANVWLLERVRTWRHAEMDAHIFLYGNSAGQEGGADYAMARNVEAHFAAHPSALLFVLGGGAHTLKLGPPIGPSMAIYLESRAIVPFRSLRWHRDGGQSWGQYENYREPNDKGSLEPWTVDLSRSDRVADGRYSVGPVSPSPAVAVEPEPPRLRP